jgi:putative alpha-1,2-mannosidase
VQSLTLDGRPYDSTWLPYERIGRGATLHFKLAAAPNKRWAASPASAPPSFDEGVEGGAANAPE